MFQQESQRDVEAGAPGVLVMGMAGEEAIEEMVTIPPFGLEHGVDGSLGFGIIGIEGLITTVEIEQAGVRRDMRSEVLPIGIDSVLIGVLRIGCQCAMRGHTRCTGEDIRVFAEGIG